ncbi:MAG TPA: hypothetical protein VGM91_12300 [Conexibacter sp.]
MTQPQHQPDAREQGGRRRDASRPARKPAAEPINAEDLQQRLDAIEALTEEADELRSALLALTAIRNPADASTADRT